MYSSVKETPSGKKPSSIIANPRTNRIVYHMVITGIEKNVMYLMFFCTGLSYVIEG
jgi:hypothetical protein